MPNKREDINAEDETPLIDEELDQVQGAGVVTALKMDPITEKSSQAFLRSPKSD